MSLSDYIMYPNPSCIGGELGVNHVKKFIKELLCDVCKKHPENNCSDCNKLKERVGGKLCH